jgi:hypothetical protein
VAIFFTTPFVDTLTDVLDAVVPYFRVIIYARYQIGILLYGDVRRVCSNA